MSLHLATGILYQFQDIHNLDTISPDDANVFIAKDPGPISITISPSPTGEPNWLFIKNQDEVNRATVTITPSSGQIDNDPTYILNWKFGVLVVYDGTDWFTFSGGGF